MTGKLCGQGLDTLERTIQSLGDQIRALPEAGRRQLDAALQEVSRAMAAVRAARQAETGPQQASPDTPAIPAPFDPTAPIPPGSQERAPGDCRPEDTPYNCDTILRQVFSAIPDTLTVIDRDFNIVMSNWHEFDRVPAEVRRGRPKCYRIYHHRDRPCKDCHVQKVIASGQPQKSEKISLFDGRTREFSAFPVQSESGQVILAAEHVRDVTGRRLAEQALKESEGRFRTLIEDSPETLFLTDVQGTILAASRVAARRLGKNLEEFVGASLSDLFSPEVAARRRDYVEQAVATGRPVRFEDARDNFSFDNHINPILDAEGKVSLLSILAIDITERINAEQALKESEARFRAIFDAAQDVIFIKDRSLRYTQVNPAMERLFDRPAADLIGKTDIDLFGAAGGTHVQAQDRRALTGEVVIETNIRLVRGEPKTFHVVKVPLYDDAGKVMKVCGIARDITDLKQAEEELSKKHLELQETAQRLEQSRNMLQLIMESIPIRVFWKDKDLRYLGCNTLFARDAGFNHPQELLGQDDFAMGWREQADLYGKDDRQVMESRCPKLNLVEPQTTPAGATIWLKTSKVPLQRPNGEVFGVMGVYEDITAHKQAEEALRESEATLRTLIEANPESLFLLDTRGVVLAASKVAAQRLDKSLQEIIGADAFALVPPEIGRKRFEIFQQVVSTGAPARFEDARGDFYLDISMTPIFSQDKVVQVAVLAVDLSLRKQAEAALRESEARFRAIFAHTPVGISMSDLTGRILETNQALQQMLGYTGEELRDVAFQKVTHPEDLGENLRFQEELLAGKFHHYSMEKRYLRKDGEIVWAQVMVALLRDTQGDPQYLLATIIDRSARKQAEAALRESEHRFRLMAETIQDVFWIATPALDRVIYASPAYEQVWGRSCEDLYQNPQRLAESIHPEDRDRALAAMVEAREQDSPSDHEYRIIQPDGTVRWIHDRGFPVRDDRGRVTLFTGVATDITGRKALEQQFQQAQKMEAVGRLAGGVAHDFNNLLTAIMGYGELMRAKIHKDDPLYGHLKNILTAGERAAALTRQLLTFSRQKIVHPQVIDLNRVVLDLEPMLRRLIGEDLELEVLMDQRPGAVKADPGQLGQIIMNLVVNARDAMSQGGRLTLKTAPVDFTVGSHSRFGLMPAGAYVSLVVQDTGAGMDEATQTHAFEPFFTTKEPGKGTGLGLSTVYGIIKQSGGYLDLESSPGAGSTFTIYLPRLEASAALPQVRSPITASFRGEETVLLVEDEEVLRGLLAKFLRLYGYTVLEARHGGEALLLCERHPGSIHVMVTDVVMPQMSGRELADRLTPLRPEMKVIYMSGYTEDTLVQHGVADLSMVFLQKPFKPIELARRVHAVLHHPVVH